MLGLGWSGLLKGLAAILGVLGVLQHLPACVQHHRPMPAHQGFEGEFVARGHVAVEQLPVTARFLHRPAGGPLQVVHHQGQRCRGHKTAFPSKKVASPR